ncbi:MAG: tyrosine-type recombinase/integrase [Gammaproteobacteria bacterium]
MRITAAWLDSRKRPKKRYDVTVTNRKGLMVRVHPSGAISFRFRYKRNGEQRVMVLGEYGDTGLSLADANELHEQALRELEKGMDPIEERARRQGEAEKARREQAEAGTVADLVEQFVHRRLRAERWDAERRQWVRDPKSKTRPRKRPDEAAALLGYRLPGQGEPKRKNTVATLISKHGMEKARDLTKRQLVALLDEIVDRGAPVVANRIYALLKQLFEFGAAKDLIPASPMAGIEAPGGEESSRKRKLTPDEIRTVWTKLHTAKMAEPTQLALKLLLVTAQRRAEVTFAEWTHFDLNGKQWTIPVELQKTEGATKEPSEPHIVPLSSLAIDVLEKLRALTGGKRWLLPSQYSVKRGDAPYSERALSRAVRDNEEHFGIPHWTPHDLRRTAASAMTMLGVPRLHVEKVLNHATDDIAEVYDRHDYLAEKRNALERWATHLTEVIEDDRPKVVPMARSA